MRSKTTIVHDERGFALFASFLMLLLLMSLAGASLVQSAIDLRATSHYKTGVQALMAAESGALHGLSTINQKLVRNFEDDIVDNWVAAGAGDDGNTTTSSTLLGPGEYTLVGDERAGYTVTVEADPSDPQSSGFVVGSGWAPMQAERTVALQLRRSNIIGAQGAIYLVDDDFNDFTEKGNKLTVDGNDHFADGTDNPGGPTVPAITTRSETVNQVVTDALRNDRADQFTGLGYDDSDPSNIKPSVLPLGGPSTDDIDDVIDDILAGTPVCPEGAPAPTCVYTTDERRVTGADLELGTPDQPAIIHLTQTDEIKIAGNWSGYGILIADGPLHLTGNMDFHGLIIARAGFANWMTGNADVIGSLWTYSEDLSVRGSIVVDYSHQALQFADNAGLGSSMGGNLPRAMIVVGWDER